jgi:hypothetical protein
VDELRLRGHQHEQILTLHERMPVTQSILPRFRRTPCISRATRCRPGRTQFPVASLRVLLQESTDDSDACAHGSTSLRVSTFPRELEAVPDRALSVLFVVGQLLSTVLLRHARGDKKRGYLRLSLQL